MKKNREKDKVLLIVEDFDFIRNIIGKEFQRNGYTIISVGRIEDAILVGGTDVPAVIIVDFEMRSNDPYLALRALHTALPESYIILMDGYTKRSSEEKAKEAGAQRTMDRTFQISSLIDILHTSRVNEVAG